MAQQLVNGLFLGSTYALFALGYTLVFGVLDRVNLAQASVFSIGGFAAVVAVTSWGVPLAVGLLAALGVGALVGVVIERVAFAPVERRPDAEMAGLLASTALGVALTAGLVALVGPEPRQFPFEVVPSFVVEFGDVVVSPVEVVVLAATLVLLAALWWLVRRTRIGLAMRTVGQSPVAAEVSGVSLTRVRMVTFALSSALGAAAGMLFGLAYDSIRVDGGAALELKGLAVIIVGGLGSLPGAVVAGLVLGLAEVATVAWLSSTARDAVAFTLLFLTLVVRPRGLFAGRAGRDV